MVGEAVLSFFNFGGMDAEAQIYESLRLILDEVVITFQDIEVKYDSRTERKYESYLFRLYTPHLHWTISRRYNDFLAFHHLLETTSINTQEQNFIKLLMFTFPTRQLFSSGDVIAQRKVAFHKFLDKAVRISAITTHLVDFLDLTPDKVALFNHALTQEGSSSLLASGISRDDEQTALSTHLKPVRLSSELCFQRESNLLDETLTKTLFSFLPKVSRTQKFQLLYSTWRDGWNLLAFYEHIERRHPVVFIIQSADSQKEIFGAYISTPVGPPSFQFKGDGQCSIFRLTGPTPVSYSPPPCDSCLPPSLYASRPTHSLLHSTTLAAPLFSDLDDHESHEVDHALATDSLEQINDEYTTAKVEYESTRSEYIFANSEYIAIGGSAAYGSNAIRLSNDFLECSCGPSDTYGNDIALVGRPSAVDKVSSVKVGEVEVFCAVGIFS
jgi:hypothetical protein